MSWSSGTLTSVESKNIPITSLGKSKTSNRSHNKLGQNNSSSNFNNFRPKSSCGTMELKLLTQPESQHRARYQTEGSRGAVKDKSGQSYPTVKVCISI